MPQGWDWVIIAVVFLLLFGASKLPQMARSLGQSARVFKSEMKGMQDDDEARAKAKSAEPPPALPPAPAPNPMPQAQAAEGSSDSDKPR